MQGMPYSRHFFNKVSCGCKFREKIKPGTRKRHIQSNTSSRRASSIRPMYSASTLPMTCSLALSKCAKKPVSGSAGRLISDAEMMISSVLISGVRFLKWFL